MTLRVAELCAGYGGLGLGLARAGLPIELAWYAENDPDAGAVMASHHPGIANLGDITRQNWAKAEPVDVLAAGYPCQSFSNAGKRKGWDDERAIWPYVADAIRHLRPRLVAVENVQPHLVRGFPDVLGDLASLGYDAQWTCLRASDVGAAHQRDRLFCIAYPAHTDGGGVWEQPVPLGGGRREAPAGDDREGPGRLDLLLTPTVEDAGRAGSAEWAARWAAGEVIPETQQRLRTQVLMLPKPRATDGEFIRHETGDSRAYPRHLDAHEDLRDLPPTVHPKAVQRPSGGPHPVPEPSQLLTSLREHPGGSYEGCPSLACPETSEADVRDVRHPNGPTRAPQGPRSREQRPLEPVDALFELSSHAALAGGSPAADGLPEHARAHNVQVAWGRYASAIRRWEAIQGRPAPDPTEPGRRGGPRLSARFVEFLMGLPDGYVTDVLPRNPALRVLGNGVVPVQAAAAFQALMSVPR